MKSLAGRKESRSNSSYWEQGSRASSSASKGPRRSRSRLRLLGFFLPQHSTQEFPCGCARQFVHEDHLARQLVLSDLVLTVFNQLAGRNTLPGLEHDESLGDLAAHLVRDADDSHVSYGRVCCQRGFDLLGPNAIGLALDDVILTGDEPKIALFVVIHVVTRPVPAVRGNGLALLFRVAPIKRPRGPADQEVADLVWGGVLAFLVHHLDLETRHDRAEGARLGVQVDHVRDKYIHHLGRAKAFENLQAEFFFQSVVCRRG